MTTPTTDAARHFCSPLSTADGTRWISEAATTTAAMNHAARGVAPASPKPTMIAAPITAAPIDIRRTQRARPITTPGRRLPSASPEYRVSANGSPPASSITTETSTKAMKLWRPN